MAFFTEDMGPTLIVSPGLTVTDSDSTNLDSATVTLTNRPDGADEVLSATVTSTISVGYDPGTGILSLTGNNTITNYQQVLRTVAYNNISQNPTTTDRKVEFIVYDGTDTSQPVTSTVIIDPSCCNDAPVLDNSGDMRLEDIDEDDTNPLGNQVVTIIDSSTITNPIIDVDDDPMGIAVIGADNSNGTWQYSIDGGSNWNDFGTVSKTSAVLLNANARIRFVPAPNFFSEQAGNITFKAWDQSGQENNGDTGVDLTGRTGGIHPFSESDETATLTVRSVNDPPIVDLNGSAPGRNSTVTFFENEGGPVAIAPTALVTDVDTQIEAATITLNNRPDGASEVLDADATGTAITANYNPGSGVLNLSGSDSDTNYQQLLRTIKYNNTSPDPDNTPRTVTFVITDGTDVSNTPVSTINVALFNNVPVLDLNGPAPGSDYTTTFTEDEGPVPVVDPIALRLTDVDDSLLISATVTLANRPDGAAEMLAADAAGTAITATYSLDTGSLTLTGTDTISNYQQILRTVTYNNSSQDPTPVDRTIVFVAHSATNHSSPVTSTVAVNAVNDAPLLDLNGPVPGTNASASFNEAGGPVSIVDADLSLTDVDDLALASASVTLTNRPDGTAEMLAADTTGTRIEASYDANSGLLSLSKTDTITNYQKVLGTVTYHNTAQVPDTRPRTVEFVTSDGTDNSNTAVSTVTINQLPIRQVYIPLLLNNFVVGEPNNHPCDAYALNINQDYFFLPDDVDDWYRFDLPSSGHLIVELTDFVPLMGQVVVYTGTSCDSIQQTPLGNNGNDQSTKVVDLGQRSAGRYFIWIINDGALNATEHYRLRVRFTLGSIQ
jgi:hypothetical protein